MRYPPGFRRRKWKTRSGERRWAYQYRTRKGKGGRAGGRTWLLGQDFDRAMERYRELTDPESISKPRTAPSTLDEAHERWRGSYVRTARNAKGERDTTTRYVNHVSPVLGQKRLDGVTGEDIRELRLRLEEKLSLETGKKLSPQTVKHVLADVRCFLLWCVETGLLDRSPFPRKMIMPRIDERPPDRLTDEEVEAVLRLEEPYGFVVRFLLGTALRWGEGCRAQRADLQGDALVVLARKTGKIRRVPLVNPVADRELLREVRRRLEVGRLVPFAVNSSGVFNRAVKRRSGVQCFHVHQLRHTFGCRYLESGGRLDVLQEILGHSTVALTQRYAKLTDPHVMAESRRLAKEVWG